MTCAFASQCRLDGLAGCSEHDGFYILTLYVCFERSVDRSFEVAFTHREGPLTWRGRELEARADDTPQSLQVNRHQGGETKKAADSCKSGRQAGVAASLPSAEQDPAKHAYVCVPAASCDLHSWLQVASQSSQRWDMYTPTQAHSPIGTRLAQSHSSIAQALRRVYNKTPLNNSEI